MSTKTQKIVAAITATALAASVMLGGTLAWQSINQEATNIVSGTINPGGRLHDDFDGNNRNKDIYVENFADQEIYARIQLREYLEIGTTEPGATTDSLVIPSGANHDATATGAVDTWAIHYFDETQNATDQYVDFTWGGMTTYLPTFNMNKDSLLADINGTYEGLTPDNLSTTDDDEADRYSDYVDYATVTGGVTGYEVWDADLDNDDEVGEDVDTLITLTDGTTTHGSFADAANAVLAGDFTTSYTEVIKDQTNAATHIPTTTRDATVISMADWKAMSDTDKDVFYGWVYDTDGWAYWSQPIEPKTVDTNGNVTSQNTTGLLLDAINPRIDDNYYYQIHVIAQFITANDLGQTDGTGFFAGDKGSNPSADALALLNTIGVNISGGSTLTVTSSAASVAPGGSVTLTATNPTTNTAVTGATWIINGSNVASTFSATSVAETSIDPATGILTVATNELASKLTVIAIYENETTDPDTQVTTKNTLIGSYDITVSATAAAPSDEYVVEISEATNATKIYAGGTLNFSAKVSKGGVEESAPTIVWDVLDETDTTGTTITDGELTVGSEPVNTVLKVTATYTDTTTSETYTDEYEVTVVADAYTVAINETPTAQLANGTATQTFTAAVTKNGVAVNNPVVTWSVDSDDANTTITGGVLTIAKTEPKDKLNVTATYEGVTSAPVEVPVTHTYALEITQEDGESSVIAGETLKLDAMLTRNGESYTGTETVVWSVSPTTSTIAQDGTLTAGASETAGTKLTVTASVAALGASDTYEVAVNVLTETQKTIATAAAGNKVTIDGIEYWVVVQDTTEKRALLWKATPVGQTTGTNGTTMRFSNTGPAWKDSEMQTYLNGTYLTSLSAELQEAIIPTTIKTANDYTRSGAYVETTDSVFLLTEADVFGSYGASQVNNPGADEYTYVKDNTPAAIVTADMIGWTPGSGTTTQYAWLRSPSTLAGGVALFDSDGGVGYNSSAFTIYYVRPAFWVNLAS